MSSTPLLDRVNAPSDLQALPLEQLPQLCGELRHEIIDICRRVGGHLGASLGAVELIVALHRVFRSPKDKLVFDVGHQAYAHKILTGRRAQMSTLRQEGGVAPFLDPNESPHDAFAAGHASTAVSVALGLMEGIAARKHDNRVVAILGDGALTGGLTFEALNHVAHAPRPLVLVLNDNNMSISPNVGAIVQMLQGSSARAFFESLGLTYVGPVEGHDMGALIQALSQARSSHKSTLVHVKTQKGKGWIDAEQDEQTKGHAMGPFEMRDGKRVRSRGGLQTYSEAFAEALERAMERSSSIRVVTPAMLEGSALMGVKRRFPTRVHDVGIAEAHAVTFAAGMAKEGLRPICCIYSTFLQRAFDSVVHDVVLPGLPVVFAIDRAGLVGADGATHQGAFDLSFLRPLPGMKLGAPFVAADVERMLDDALSTTGPVALRFPRGTVERAEWPSVDSQEGLMGGRWLKRAEASELTIIALGTLNAAALQAASAEAHWSVLDARWVTPLDEQKVLEAARDGALLVVEEGTVHGGLGSAVLEFLARHGRCPKVELLGLPDVWVRHGDARAQRARLGLDAEGIRHTAKKLLGKS